MKICYIDEAGCTGALPSSTSNIQPVLVIGGIIIDYIKLSRATEELINLKQKFFPGIAPSNAEYLSCILAEIKGGELRKNACLSAKKQRSVFGYLNGILDICDRAEAKLIGRIWVKGIAQPFDGMAVYTSSMQALCSYFHDYLARQDDLGVMIADSRLKHLNSRVAHSIFTQKFKSSGDVYDRLIELPAFAHSDNHAGLQIADALCSALITPIAIHSYCSGHINSIHVRPGYADFKTKYAARIRPMQHRYQIQNGRWLGGLVVADDISHLGGAEMFK
jgi:hypothetical protein